MNWNLLGKNFACRSIRIDSQWALGYGPAIALSPGSLDVEGAARLFDGTCSWGVLAGSVWETPLLFQPFVVIQWRVQFWGSAHRDASAEGARHRCARKGPDFISWPQSHGWSHYPRTPVTTVTAVSKKSDHRPFIIMDLGQPKAFWRASFFSPALTSLLSITDHHCMRCLTSAYCPGSSQFSVTPFFHELLLQLNW